MTKNIPLRVRTRTEVKALALALTGQQSRAAVAPDDAGDTSSTDTGTSGELWLYGVVGGWWRGFDAESVSTALRGMDVDTLYVRIHSPGGNAADGVAIGNLLRNHRAKVVVVVDGLAASAASVIAIAGDEVVMCPGSQFMLHDPSTFAAGNAADLREMADWIDAQAVNYAGVYAYRAGGTAEAWREVMTANNGWGTWYTAEEAVTAGLADSVGTRTAVGSPPTAPVDDLDDDEMWAKAAHDLELFDQCVHPAARAAWQGEPPKPPSASARGSHPTKEELVDFTPEQIAGLREQVGFPEDADAATIAAALTEALNERADTSSATPAVPTDHVVIPQARLTDLEAGARAGLEAQKALHIRDRAALLDANRAKYLGGTRASWETEYDRNPDAVRAHFASAPDLVPVTELGHANDQEADASVDVRESDTYKNWSI